MVEDEAGVRRLVVRILKRRGFEVVAAEDPARALELVAEGFTPMLLVTDVVMPGMGGVELAEAMAERFPDLPTLFISGYSDRSLDGVLSDSNQDFLSKPFTPTQLAERVGALLAARD